MTMAATSGSYADSRRLRKQLKRLKLWRLRHRAQLRYGLLSFILACVLWRVPLLHARLPPMDDLAPRLLLFSASHPGFGGDESLVPDSSSSSKQGVPDAMVVATPPPNLQQEPAPTPPKACLAMIMKNEGPILPRLFESVRGFVSEYCVVDTGSTDDTIAVLKSIDMPGVLVKEPFVNFAVTRNFLLDTCREKTDCDYLVLLDADMVLKVSPEWDWAKLDGQDVYDFVQVSSIEYNNVRMVRRTADKIRVVGATHEYYDVPADYTHRVLPKRLVYIDDVGDGKAKGDKFERDERLLRAELEREPDNVRTVFYLANTLKDQGKYREAIPFYERRATMGGWYAEADYSLYMLSACYLALGDLDNGRRYGERAGVGVWYRRAEPLYFLALYLHQHEQHHLAWYYASLAATIPKPSVESVLFITYSIYDYWVDYERASLCRHVFAADPLHSLQVAFAFLNNGHAPQDLREYFLPDLNWHVRPLLTAQPQARQGGDVGSGNATRSTIEDAPYAILLDKGREGPVRAFVRVKDDSTGTGTSFAILERMDDGGYRWTEQRLRMEAAGVFDVRLLAAAGGAADAASASTLLGTSADGATLYRGAWDGVVAAERDPAGDAAVALGAYRIDKGDGQGAWPVFERAHGSEVTTYCITSWYPTVEIGTLQFSSEHGTARCEPSKSIGSPPRLFSFFSHVSHAANYRDEVWLLARWARVRDSVAMFSIVVLGTDDFQLRVYTYPFTLETSLNHATGAADRSDEQCLAFEVVERPGETASAVFAYHSRIEGSGGGGGDSTNGHLRIREVPLTRLWALMVSP